MYDFTVPANSLEEFWMPFTPQRYFKKAPRILTSAQGMYYTSDDGRKILDGAAGMWCVNAGHNPPRIVEAIKSQLDQMGYAPCFQYGHPAAFQAASRLVAAMPKPISHVFFSNSGSEAVDTALKIALAYHRARGDGGRRVLIGRERAYHGVGFGGISVGGLPYNRAVFGQLLPFVDHLPHTHNLEHNSFKRGMPDWGAHLADELERIVTLHDPSNVAAVIVEPVSGSTGVLPPPKGYLNRLREICDKYGILLIFDEVVTAFGRFGEASSAPYFGVMPDMIATAKGLTNGMVPMGATFVTQKIYDAFMEGPETSIELMHGYTYSGHPLACAAAIATLDTYIEDGVFENAKKMAPIFEEAVHALKGKPHVIDIRNCGMVAGVQLEEHSKDDPAKYARDTSYELFRRGVMLRYSGTNLYLSPPLIITESQIGELMDSIGKVLEDL
jgi:beta-alanine--pyruvate transaminase